MNEYERFWIKNNDKDGYYLYRNVDDVEENGECYGSIDVSLYRYNFKLFLLLLLCFVLSMYLLR